MDFSNKFMVSLCRFLASNLNFWIFILAICELVFAVVAGYKLFELKKKIIEINKSKVTTKAYTDKEFKGKVKRTTEFTTSYDYHLLDPIRDDYQKTQGFYTIFSLIIQLFPLFGILGTVSGLYYALYDGKEIYAGVSFALSSTILGISWSIIYKIVDMIYSAFAINFIVESIERYEKDFNVDNEEAKLRLSGEKKDEST